MSNIKYFLFLSCVILRLVASSTSVAKQELSSTIGLSTGTKVHSTKNIETTTPSEIIGLEDVNVTSTTLNNKVTSTESGKMSTEEENISTTPASNNLEHSSETISEVSTKKSTPLKVEGEIPLMHKSVVKHNRQIKSSSTTRGVEEKTSSTTELPNNLSSEPLKTSLPDSTTISALSDNKDDLTTVGEKSSTKTDEGTVSNDGSSMEIQTQKIEGKSVTRGITEEITTTTPTSVSEIKDFEKHSTKVKENVGTSLNQTKKQIADNLEHTRKLGMLAAGDKEDETRHLKGCNSGDRSIKQLAILNAIMFYLVCNYANYM